MTNSFKESMLIPEPVALNELENKARLDLVYEVSRKIGSASRMTELLEQIIRMTQKTLNASAASVLLTDNNEQEMFFEAASGPVGKVLKQVKLNTQCGIVGQVARTGTPVIVNDVNETPHFDRTIDSLTGFVTESVICVPLVAHHAIIGVMCH